MIFMESRTYNIYSVDVQCPEIYKTDYTISDRRSTFTAHLATVTHRKQVRENS